MWYDLGMCAILIWTTIRGAAKGIAWQIAAIAALILCFAFATPLSLVVAPAIHVDPPLNRWLAMLAIYLVFSFGCFGAARLLRGWLEAIRFEEYDRHLGALFGFIKGATICLVITFFVVCLSQSGRDYVMRQARAGRLAGQTLDQLASVMPSEFEAVLAPYLRRFDDATLIAAEDGAAEIDEDRLTGFRGSARQPEDLFDSDEGPIELTQPDTNAETEDTNDRPSQVGDLIARGIKGAVARLGEQVVDLLRDSIAGENADQREIGKDGDPPARRPPAAERDVRHSIADEIEAICGIYSPSRSVRDSQRAEIEILLQGIPPRTALAALRDWHADLAGARTDPDPETGPEASLDLRITRSLAAAGIDRETLPRPVAERLREAVESWAP